MTPVTSLTPKEAEIVKAAKDEAVKNEWSCAKGQGWLGALFIKIFKSDDQVADKLFNKLFVQAKPDIDAETLRWFSHSQLEKLIGLIQKHHPANESAKAIFEKAIYFANTMKHSADKQHMLIQAFEAIPAKVAEVAKQVVTEKSPAPQPAPQPQQITAVPHAKAVVQAEEVTRIATPTLQETRQKEYRDGRHFDPKIQNKESAETQLKAMLEKDTAHNHYFIWEDSKDKKLYLTSNTNIDETKRTEIVHRELGSNAIDSLLTAVGVKEAQSLVAYKWGTIFANDTAKYSFPNKESAEAFLMKARDTLGTSHGALLAFYIDNGTPKVSYYDVNGKEQFGYELDIQKDGTCAFAKGWMSSLASIVGYSVDYKPFSQFAIDLEATKDNSELETTIKDRQAVMQEVSKLPCFSQSKQAYDDFKSAAAMFPEQIKTSFILYTKPSANLAKEELHIAFVLDGHLHERPVDTTQDQRVHTLKEAMKTEGKLLDSLLKLAETGVELNRASDAQKIIKNNHDARGALSILSGAAGKIYSASEQAVAELDFANIAASTQTDGTYVVIHDRSTPGNLLALVYENGITNKYRIDLTTEPGKIRIVSVDNKVRTAGTKPELETVGFKIPMDAGRKKVDELKAEVEKRVGCLETHPDISDSLVQTAYRFQETAVPAIWFVKKEAANTGFFSRVQSIVTTKSKVELPTEGLKLVTIKNMGQNRFVYQERGFSIHPETKRFIIQTIESDPPDLELAKEGYASMEEAAKAVTETAIVVSSQEARKLHEISRTFEQLLNQHTILDRLNVKMEASDLLADSHALTNNRHFILKRVDQQTAGEFNDKELSLYSQVWKISWLDQNDKEVTKDFSFQQEETFLEGIKQDPIHYPAILENIAKKYCPAGTISLLSDWDNYIKKVEVRRKAEEARPTPAKPSEPTLVAEPAKKSSPIRKVVIVEAREPTASIPIASTKAGLPETISLLNDPEAPIDKLKALTLTGTSYAERFQNIPSEMMDHIKDLTQLGAERLLGRIMNQVSQDGTPSRFIATGKGKNERSNLLRNADNELKNNPTWQALKKQAGW